MKLISTEILFVIAPVLLVAFISCDMGGYKNIPPEKAKQMLESQQSSLLLDVRSPEEYREGHLKNSVLIPIQELPDRMKEIWAFKDKDVIVYCAVGGRSSKASAMLKEKGFQNVYNMNGGIKAWSQAGYEVVK